LLINTQGNKNLERNLRTTTSTDVKADENEISLLDSLVILVRHFDPDVLTGYELNNSSWGYLIERAATALDYDLSGQLSRVRNLMGSKLSENQWAMHHTTTVEVTGRHMLNIWRVLRGELNLLQYTMENVVYHTLHDRLPRYTNDSLTEWVSGEDVSNLALFVKYYSDRVNYDIRIVQQQDLIGRYSEQARLLGVDYYSVFYRGSQFKVESLMARIAKPENFIFISPSKKQVGQQNALEYIPLVMEPESSFYTSPVLVLDFQSLYPSIIIAYNYCYSTCLGRVSPWRGTQNKFGVVPNFELPPGLLPLLKDYLTVAPNGIIYVKSELRKSLLAKMLTEILDTRVMIKDSMKKYNLDDAGFQRAMNSRQIALKLIANVTYGYTSASFSGRMPSTEIADSIVSTGREIFESAIDTIRTTTIWGAEVVYGDTDSLFVHLEGKTRDQAFEIGQDIARTITQQNRSPIQLKFEKVYHPCILQTKKRYVGYKYETQAQKLPVFDAKGIETVRRDGTPAEQKIEEKAMRILFDSSDLSQVKEYLVGEWFKIMTGNVSIQDFCFAKAVKLGSYSSNAGTLPPGAAISLQKMQLDARATPQYNERVPYVVIAGAPGSRLVDRCVTPEYLLQNLDSCRLDAHYYITKNLIPPLERLLSLAGANVRSWYDEMPREASSNVNSGALRQYMKSGACRVCRSNKPMANPILCVDCVQDSSASIYKLEMRRKTKEQEVLDLQSICSNCAGARTGGIACVSADCPIFYSKIKARTALIAANIENVNA
jgi:DNA polymerase zeta